MTIRKALTDDASQIAALHLRTLCNLPKEAGGQDGYDEKDIQERTQLITDSISRGNNFAVYTEDDQILGFLCSGDKRDDVEYTTEIYALYVDPSHQKKGIGRFLFEDLKEKLKNSGRSGLYLWVWEDNINAIKFYETMGGAENKTYKTRDEGKYKCLYYWAEI